MDDSDNKQLSTGSNHPIVSYDTEDTCRQLIQRADLIKGVLDNLMKVDVHYGQIPGTKGMTLLKPGAEKLMSAFQIAPQVDVVDLSDKEVHYRVIVTGVQMHTGLVVGQGVGECSSREEKYAWRKALNNNEYGQFLAKGGAYAREKWRRGYKNSPDYIEYQVRADPMDKANTILKMAKKRALSDFCLTALAASDIFDIEPPETNAETRSDARATQGQQRKQQARRPAKQPPSDRQPPPQQSTQQAPIQQEKVVNEAPPEQATQAPAAQRISADMHLDILNKLDVAAISVDELLETMQLADLHHLRVDQVESVYGWIKANDQFGGGDGDR